MRIFPIALVPAFAISASGQVKVCEGTLALPTHQEGPANPNPPFDAFESRRFNYPYVLRDTLSGSVRTQNWRALYLENEYLRCAVLPDVGGHLYDCQDKRNQAHLFYANPSLKKALISYRGAWAAFGVEFNFPVSHNWATLSPVDFASAVNADGSGSVWVANTDRVYGLRWNVKLTLRPGSTVLEQETILSNPTSLRHRYYWWNNAAMQVWDDSLIEYPQTYTASHGFTTIDTWPVNQTGRNLRVVGEHLDGPVSQFAHASREPFMGVYHPRTQAGTVHYAEPSEAPAKKIWAWGVNDDGLRWRERLSDDNSAYVEVQAGIFRNQETFSFLDPLETVRIREYWMPVREIGGITRANLHAVAHVSGTAPRRLGLNVQHRVPNGRLHVQVDGRTVEDRRANFAPDQSVFIVLPDSGKVSVHLYGNDGAELFSHNDGVFDMAAAGSIQPGQQSPPNTPDAGDGVVLMKGDDLERNGQLLQAWETYQDGLHQFPGSFLLLRAAGRLALDLNRFQEARVLLEQARDRVTNDSATLYALGLAQVHENQPSAARISFERASATGALRASALRELAGLEARQKAWGPALDFIQSAREIAPQSVALQADELMLLRTQHKRAEAVALLKNALRSDPSNPTLRWEAYLLGELKADEVLSHLASDPYRLLDVARAYLRLGLYADAATLLAQPFPQVDQSWKEPGTLSPAQNPLVAYYRGYAKLRLDESPAADFENASQLPLSYVFPRRAETAAVLEAALQSNPSDASALALLGHLRMASGLTEQAVAYWRRAAAIRPEIPALHRSLGWTLMHLQNKPAEAIAAFQEGVRADAENPDVYLGLTDAQLALNRSPEDRIASLEKYPKLADAPASIVYALALAYAEAKHGDKALALFQNRFFPSEELGLDVRTVFVEARIQALLAKIRAGESVEFSALDHLAAPLPDADFSSSGVDAVVDSSRVQYLMGIAAKEARVQGAGRYFERAFALGENSRNSAAIAWAILAADQVPTADKGVLEQLRKKLHPRPADSEYADSQQAYTNGMVHWAIGDKEAAKQCFQAALRGPDRNLGRYFSYRNLKELARMTP